MASRDIVQIFQKRVGVKELGGLHPVNVIVMVKIEKGNKLLLFVYFIDQDKSEKRGRPENYKLISIDGKRGVSHRARGEGRGCFRLKIGKGEMPYFSK